MNVVMKMSKATSGLFCVDYHDINREFRESILTFNSFQLTFHFDRDLTDKTCTENSCVIFREKSLEVPRLRM